MTAQGSVAVPVAESICHIYNKSPEGKNLFSDAQDYASFLGFLEEYLLPPKPENKTKEFTINGKIYKGVSHMPKNYSGTISLLAYSLTPTQFDLIIKYSDKDTLQKFMRSLSTRYSIYFHKKYPDSHKVFKDTYISKDIKDDISILNLSQKLHQNTDVSSLQEYLGSRITKWVDATYILDIFKNSSQGKYEDFVSTKPEQIEAKKIRDEKVIEQKEVPSLETLKPIPQAFSGEEQYIMVTSGPGFREVFVAGSIFLVLLTFGFKKVYTTSYTSEKQGASKQMVNQHSTVLSEKTEAIPDPPTAAEEVIDPSREFAVIITDDEFPININSEASLTSPKIAKAYDGDVFEIISESEDGKWYEIKLNDESTGYIESKYIEINQK